MTFCSAILFSTVKWRFECIFNVSLLNKIPQGLFTLQLCHFLGAFVFVILFLMPTCFTEYHAFHCLNQILLTVWKMKLASPPNLALTTLFEFAGWCQLS